jgi:hypothetical protein
MNNVGVDGQPVGAVLTFLDNVLLELACEEHIVKHFVILELELQFFFLCHNFF